MFDEMSASHFKRNANNEGGIRSPLDGFLFVMHVSYIHNWSLQAFSQDYDLASYMKVSLFFYFLLKSDILIQKINEAILLNSFS